MGQSQPALTCEKLTIETLEQGVKYRNKDTRTTSVTSIHILF